MEICNLESYNIALFDDKHLPDKKWLLDPEPHGPHLQERLCRAADQEET